MSSSAEQLAKQFLDLPPTEQKNVIALIQQYVFSGGSGGLGNKTLGEVNTINFAPGPGSKCPTCGR